MNRYKRDLDIAQKQLSLKGHSKIKKGVEEKMRNH